MHLHGELARLRWVLASPERAAARARLALAAGAVVVSGLFAIRLWPRWDALRVAQADTSAEPVQTVVYVHAVPGKGSHDLSLPASVRAYQEATLYARTNGYLKRWLVDIGDRVRAGQLLAEIEVPEAERELEEARARVRQVSAHLELARITAERYRNASRDEAVSPQELDEKLGAERVREADLAAAKAHVQRLEQMRAYQRVTAPFAGTIVARNVEVGSLVQAGSSSANGWLFKLSQTDRMRVQVNVPQSYARMIQPGMSAGLVVRELGNEAFGGKVERTAGAFDPATRTIVAELLVPNPHGKILPGMYGQARFEVIDAHPNIVIPVTALIVGGDGLQVAVLDGKDAVRFRKVSVLRDLGKQVEVTDGLIAKERVINNPRDTLQEGQQVRAVLQEQPGDKERKAGPRPADARADKAKT